MNLLSKIKLFDMCQYAFVNADNVYSAKVLTLIKDKCKVETYGIDNFCNLLAKDVTITNTYADFKVKIETRNERVKVGIPGRFSVYNALAAIALKNDRILALIFISLAFAGSWVPSLIFYAPGEIIEKLTKISQNKRSE